MIGKLYLYFGVIGMASLLAWIVALGMLVNYAWHDRRHEFYLRAFLLATLGVILASLNSCCVRAIQIDWTEQNKQALQQQMALRESEMKRLKDRAAAVHFAEDDAYDNLDLAGVRNADQLNKYERAARGIQATPAYKKAGKQSRVIEDAPDIDGAFDEESSPGDERNQTGKRLPPDERQQAQRWDRLNRAASRISWLIVAFCLGWDYWRRQSQTFGNALPLPISGSLLDAGFPKKHSCALGAGQPDVIRRYLIHAVRKGEPFIYLGPADPLRENTLPQLYLPLRDMGRHLVSLMVPRSVLKAARFLGRVAWNELRKIGAWLRAVGMVVKRIRNRCLQVVVRAAKRVLPVKGAPSGQPEHGNAPRKIASWRNLILRGASPLRAWFQKALRASTSWWVQAQTWPRGFVQRLKGSLSAARVFHDGCVELWPMPKIAYTEASPPFSREFVLESSWFGRSCFVFAGYPLSLTMIGALHQFLDFRYQPRAVARKTVHVVWDFTEPVPGRLLHDLITLVREANFQLLICAPEHRLAELSGVVEEISPQRVPPRGRPSCLTWVFRRSARALLPLVSRVRMKAATLRQWKERKARRRKEIARPVPEETPVPKPAEATPEAPPPVVRPKPVEKPPAEWRPVPASAGWKSAGTPRAKQKIRPVPKPEEAAPQKMKASVRLKEAISPPGAEESPLPAAPVIVEVSATRDAFKFLCPYCQQKLSVTLDLQGINVPCPTCKQDVTVPYLSPPDAGAGAAAPGKQRLPSVEQQASLVDVDKERKLFKFLCPYCQQKLSAPFTAQGIKMPCPTCAREISLPFLQ